MSMTFLSCFCYLLLVVVGTVQASTIEVGNFILESKPGVAWPSHLTDCELTMEESRLSCVRRCVSTPTCVSLYLELDHSPSEPLPWKCRSCETAVPLKSLHTGAGFYATFKHRYLGVSPPLVPDGVLVKTEVVLGVEAAFYDCVKPSDVKLRLARDKDTGMWPRLNQECRANLCNQSSLSMSLVRVTFDDEGFILLAQCHPGEMTDVFSRCYYNGTWALASASGVLCISSTCYRRNAKGRAFYKGHQSSTKSGHTCQKWSSLFPNPHLYRLDFLYVEDGFSYVNALNYCRDPDYTGKPWCYTTRFFDPRWEFCGIPRCQ